MSMHPVSGATNLHQRALWAPSHSHQAFPLTAAVGFDRDPSRASTSFVTSATKRDVVKNAVGREALPKFSFMVLFCVNLICELMHHKHQSQCKKPRRALRISVTRIRVVRVIRPPVRPPVIIKLKE